jgi:hypothetical protein
MRTRLTNRKHNSATGKPWIKPSAAGLHYPTIILGLRHERVLKRFRMLNHSGDQPQNWP